MTGWTTWVLAILFSFLVVGPKPAEGQDAFVTFYSHGSELTSGIPGTKHDVYNGNIFDGTQGVFSFLDSHIAHNNRYLTLRLASGLHTLGASNGKRPEPRETLNIELKAGEHYFVRAQGESKGVPLVFTLQQGRLDLVPCTVARAEMIKAKPLTDKALWKYTKARRATMVVDESAPPPCS